MKTINLKISNNYSMQHLPPPEMVKISPNRIRWSNSEQLLLLLVVMVAAWLVAVLLAPMMTKME